MDILSTPDQNSPRNPFGPFNVIKQIYQKDKMPSFIQSEDSLINCSNQIPQRISPSRHASRTRLQQSWVQRSSILKQHLKPRFVKLFQQKQFVTTFITNLYQNSYVMKLGNYYLKEKYLSLQDQNKNDQSQQNRKKYIIRPGSCFLIIWDLIGISIIALSLWLCPFLACFLQQYDAQNEINETQTHQIFKHLIAIIALYAIIDFIISMNRGFIQKGEVIYDRTSIIKNYFQHTFFTEIMNLIMWSLFYFDYSVNEFVSIIQMIIIFLQIRKKIIIQYEQFYLRGGLNHILDLVNVILSIYFVAHTMACFWFYIGNITSHKFGHSWLLKYDLYNASIWMKYSYSLYWATMTMATVGYGDITAQNDYEVVSSIVMMFISSCTFAYSMNSIGYILKVIYEQKEQYKYFQVLVRKSLIQINQHMSNNNIDSQLQSRIRNYLQYFFQEEKYGSQEDIDKIYAFLPPSLRSELTIDIKMRIVRKIKMLSFLTLQTQQSLSQEFEALTFLPGDTISLNDSSFFYIQSGLVSVLEKQSKTEIENLQDGESFGEYGFLTGFNQNLLVRAKSICKIYRLDRTKFLELIKYNQRDFEMYHQLKDNLEFNNDYHEIHLKCKFCHKYSHLSLNCSNNFYNPNLERIVKSEYFHQQHHRNRTFLRKDRKIFNSIYNSQLIQTCAKMLEDNQSLKGTSQEEWKNSITMVDVKSDFKTQKFHSQRNVLEKTSNSYQIIDDVSQENVDLNRIFNQKNQKEKSEMMLEQFRIEKYNQTAEIDQIYAFSIYKKQNNLDSMVKEYEKALRRYPKSYSTKLQQSGRYTFYFWVKLNAIKIRAILDKSL